MGRFNLGGDVQYPIELLIYTTTVALAMFVTMKMKLHQVAELVEASE